LIPSPAPSIRYLGFEATGQGRQYAFQVEGEPGPRVFRFVIPHAAFARRSARFQDAPDLCFSRLQRDLEQDAGLVPGPSRVLTEVDLAEYRDRQVKHGTQRKRRGQAA
jgi:hypothetical protein